MFIRYHLFYYALASFLIVLSLYNPVFYLFLALYLVFFIKKTSFINVLVFIVGTGCALSILSIIPGHDETFYSEIEGKVVRVSDSYIIVSTDVQRVKVYSDDAFSYGDHVVLTIGELTINEQRNDYGFDESLYLKANNIQVKAYLITIVSQRHSYNLVDLLESMMSDEERVRSFQRLFILGVRDSYIEDDYDQLLNLSIVHLFALSGLHINYLKKMLESLMSYLIPRQYAQGMIYGLLFIYLIHIPFSISLWRAYLMMVEYDYGKDYLNELDIYSLCFMGFVLYNRYIIFNYSFMFSFGIYLIVLFVRNMKYASFYIYLFSLPIIIYSQNQIFLLSLLFSMCLGIFVEYFYISIVLSLLIHPLNNLVSLMVYILEKIMNLASVFDCFLIFREPNLSFVIFFYAISIMVIIKKEKGLRCDKEMMVLLSLMIAFFIYGRFPLYAQVSAIDVGQGDSFLIRMPFNQGSVLIDTGGSYDYDLATTTLIPYFKSIGLAKIDYVYISHGDYDHCGALESLQENFKIGEVIEDYEDIKVIGDMVIEMLTTDEVYSDLNDNSLIMEISMYGYHFLFTGDISSEVESDLLAKYEHLDIDFLKVAHHGSKYSSSPELFELISPKVAMISVGEGNLYGHPSDEVIERLTKKGITILRTDEMGMYHIRFYGKSYYIFT